MDKQHGPRRALWGIAIAAISLGATMQARVYYGSLEGAARPAEVAAGAVLNSTSEYQAIRDRGLTSEDSEYWLLLNRANTKFYAAVGKAARAHQCDVVVEQGSGSFETSPVNLTQAAIDALEQ